MRIVAVAFVAAGLLAPSAGVAQWTQGAPGKLWVKSALYFQKTDRRFDFEGKRVPWLGDGESDARVVYTDLIVGLRPNLDFWLQVPFLDLRFRSVAVDTVSRGFGDIRAWFRWRALNLMNGSTPVSLRIGAKAPIGDSPVDAQIIPLGEGQWDIEVFGEIGHSFWPVRAYSELWLGYRARFENTETTRDPGGEYIVLAETGYQPTPGSLLKATFDGLWSRRLKTEGVVTATQRRIVNLQFAGAVRIGPVWPEFAVRVPLSGQENPAGVQYVFGFSSQVR